MDVKTGFLHGGIEEELYIEIPYGFAIPDKKHSVCKRSSLYWLKQAPRRWYKQFGLLYYQVGLNGATQIIAFKQKRMQMTFEKLHGQKKTRVMNLSATDISFKNASSNLIKIERERKPARSLVC